MAILTDQHADEQHMEEQRKVQRQETETERKEERGKETQAQKKFRACFTSVSGGNQVDGLPPVVHSREKDEIREKIDMTKQT